MTQMEKAIREATIALKECDRRRTGLVIMRIADEYGVDSSALGRELWRKSKEEKEEKVKETVWLDMEKVKALGCGGDLGKLARFCGLGHDTLRIAEGRNGKGVQRRTVQKIAAKFGKDYNDLLHDENRQIELHTEEPRTVWKQTPTDYLTEEERKILRVLAVCSGKTEEEIEHYAVKRFIEKMGVVPLKELKIGGGK